MAFAAVLQHLRSGIWYPSTIVSLLNTPRFHQRRAAFSCWFPFKKRKGKDEKVKLMGARKDLSECFFSPCMSNVGSDDILILSLRVCETAPSVCFCLISVMAANIKATVLRDKLLCTYVSGLFSSL